MKRQEFTQSLTLKKWFIIYKKTQSKIPNSVPTLRPPPPVEPPDYAEILLGLQEPPHKRQRRDTGKRKSKMISKRRSTKKSKRKSKRRSRKSKRKSKRRSTKKSMKRMEFL